MQMRVLILTNQNTPSPTLQRGPIQPGGQTHTPLTGSHDAPLSQLQKNSQFGPYRPDLHAETHTCICDVITDAK